MVGYRKGAGARGETDGPVRFRFGGDCEGRVRKAWVADAEVHIRNAFVDAYRVSPGECGASEIIILEGL